MPKTIPLPGVKKVSESFSGLIGVGMLLALCFYFPGEHSTHSLVDSCREWIGFLVWVPLGVLLATLISFGIWATLSIRCPQCGCLIRSGGLSDRRTVLYPCKKCEVLWDSEIEQRDTSSSGN